MNKRIIRVSSFAMSVLMAFLLVFTVIPVFAAGNAAEWIFPKNGDTKYISVGDVFKLEYELFDENSQIITDQSVIDNTKITWSIEHEQGVNPGIKKVGDLDTVAGTVTAVGCGQIIIRGDYTAASGTPRYFIYSIYVAQQKPDKIIATSDPIEFSLKKQGPPYSLVSFFNGSPEDASRCEMDVVIADPAIASYDKENDEFKLLKAGTTTMTVSAAADPGVSTTVTLIVSDGSEADADYTAVEEAQKKAHALDRFLFNPSDLDELDAALKAVVTGLKASEQGKVDAMAQRILTALDRLKITDGWHSIEETWYYYKNNEKLKGWQTIDGYTYYLDKNSGARWSGMVPVDGKTYYLSSDGVLLYGWFNLGQYRYYADPKDGALASGIVEINGTRYHFDEKQYHLIPYIIQWVNSDGTMLQEDEVEAGVTPSYYGDTPQSPDAADGKTYVFAGWDKDIVPADADAIYTAQYQEVTVKTAAPDVEVPEDLKEEFGDAFENAGKTLGVDPVKLAQSAGSAFSDDEIQKAKENSNDVYIEIKFNISVYGLVSDEKDEIVGLTLDITPAGVLTDGTKELSGEKPLTVDADKPIHMEIPIGNLFADLENLEKLYVLHDHNGTRKTYEGSVSVDDEGNRFVSFENTQGFSEFTLLAEDPAMIKIGDVLYDDLQSAVYAVEDYETIVVTDKADDSVLSATVYWPVTFYIDAADGKNVKLEPYTDLEMEISGNQYSFDYKEPVPAPEDPYVSSDNWAFVAEPMQVGLSEAQARYLIEKTDGIVSVRSWDMYTTDGSGALVTFRAEDATDKSKLYVFHNIDGAWVSEPIIQKVNNTCTVWFDKFSPVALVVYTPSDKPEPAPGPTPRPTPSFADYKAVTNAAAEVKKLNRDLYTEESLKAVDDAVAQVKRGLTKYQQAKVDEMAKAIEEALSALEMKGADYTAVNNAIAKIDALDPKLYTEESFKAVEEAVAAVENDLKIDQQAKVDEMMKAIEEAIAGLELKKVDPVYPDGWNKIEGKWYYYNDNVAKKGWLRNKGSWYYLDPITGIMQSGWLYSEGTWYYLSPISGAMMTGWQWINNVWYFLKADGAMAANEWCEGYWLNANGAWTYPYIGQWYLNNTGWWFGDSSGWYARNGVSRINGVDYWFNASGYWVQ